MAAATFGNVGALQHSPSDSDSPRRMTDLDRTSAFSFPDDKQRARHAVTSMDSAERLELASIAEENEELLEKHEQEHDGDVEAQASTKAPATPNEYTVSTTKKLFYLGLYFLLNLSVTLSNKAILSHASYPWLLTFNHTTATSIGCALFWATGQFKLTKLSWRENMILVAFSALFTLNIAISNVSLALVSVPFHQVMRSSCPVVTILIYRFLFNRTYGTETYLSMIPLILGVALATFGDYYFTITGFLLTILGVVLASIKTVATNQLMTGSLKLPAMEVLLRMSPLAALQCLLYAAGSGEIGKLRVASGADLFTPTLIAGILGNASMAFALNLVSFQTNKVAGALTISVCGNVKQCLTILLGIVLFSVKVTPLNGIGMLIAVSGAAYYSKVELARKKAAS